MKHRSQRNGASAKRLIDRLDRAAHDMNAMLLVLAIGLAALDATCFFAFQARNALSEVNRVSADPSVAGSTMAAGRSTQAVAPAKQSGAGW